MQWNETDFVVQCPWGDRTVTGRVCQPFGVHDVSDAETCWAVVHVPSGLYLTPGPGFRYRETAEQFCERIAELTNWCRIDPGSPPSDLGEQIFDIWTDMRNA